MGHGRVWWRAGPVRRAGDPRPPPGRGPRRRRAGAANPVRHAGFAVSPSGTARCPPGRADQPPRSSWSPGREAGERVPSGVRGEGRSRTVGAGRGARSATGSGSRAPPHRARRGHEIRSAPTAERRPSPSTDLHTPLWTWKGSLVFSREGRGYPVRVAHPEIPGMTVGFPKRTTNALGQKKSRPGRLLRRAAPHVSLPRHRVESAPSGRTRCAACGRSEKCADSDSRAGAPQPRRHIDRFSVPAIVISSPPLSSSRQLSPGNRSTAIFFRTTDHLFPVRFRHPLRPESRRYPASLPGAEPEHRPVTGSSPRLPCPAGTSASST
ncbi:hypothetical protein SAMN05444320_1059 [Streptoalloteichus hindustanus]|uniref:Uncharacterized protein n=1 Tax=Streptoalloteichus hindustanus TaxID=2017 RepID=A0A1M5EIX6_STRHI|nr:hypothetical protein SAMN05444320_1059 [Streptoalloteichus hindustanus]